MTLAEIRAVCLAGLFFMAGCGYHQMTREEVVSAVKFCEDHGMKAVLLTRPAFDDSIGDVQCWVKELATTK